MGDNKKISGIEYINYKQYLIRRRVYDLENIIFFLGLIFELVYYCLNLLLNMIIIPSGVYMLKTFICYVVIVISIRIFAMFNSRTDMRNISKNNVCCITTVVIATAIGCLHCDYPLLWTLPAIMVLFGSIFGYEKILLSLFATSILGQGLFFGLACFEQGFVSTYYATSLFLAIALSAGIYFISKLIVKYIGKQLEDIVYYYDGERELKQQLETEYLTGLLSRSAINNELSQAVHDAYFFHKQLICVAMIDLDFFKRVNDTYGHDKGDQVLKRLAGVFKDYLDDDIRAGRVGGEEFLIVFRNQSKLECKEILNGMLRNFRSQKFDFLPEDENLTFSGGMCWMDNEDMDEQKLRQYADKALYYSKEHGRNRITEFKQSMLEPR